MNIPSSYPDRSPERETMVERQLAARGVRSPLVLAAMRELPRERFLPSTLQEQAYEDRALGIDCGQTISQPFMVAMMSELLELTRDSRVLEVGTGSGYQTAILARLAGEVFSMEWHLPLLVEAGERLKRLGITNVTLRCGDGSLGWPEHAPYDGILVAAGAPALPEALVDQLAIGGKLVIPVGPHDSQTLLRIRRDEQGLTREESVPCRFVPLVGRGGWQA